MIVDGVERPFAKPAPPGWDIPFMETCDADSRIRYVRSFTAGQCRAVIAERWRYQLTVVAAAERRLRKLEKGKA